MFKGDGADLVTNDDRNIKLLTKLPYETRRFRRISGVALPAGKLPFQRERPTRLATGKKKASIVAPRYAGGGHESLIAVDRRHDRSEEENAMKKEVYDPNREAYHAERGVVPSKDPIQRLGGTTLNFRSLLIVLKRERKPHEEPGDRGNQIADHGNIARRHRQQFQKTDDERDDAHREAKPVVLEERGIKYRMKTQTSVHPVKTESDSGDDVGQDRKKIDLIHGSRICAIPGEVNAECTKEDRLKAAILLFIRVAAVTARSFEPKLVRTGILADLHGDDELFPPRDRFGGYNYVEGPTA